MKRVKAEICPQFHYAVELIGRRWTGAILAALFKGSTRFSGLRESIPDITDRMLTERLQELEHHGIVLRNVIPETPVKIEYSLTEKGRALKVPLDAITDWAHDWVTLSSECIEGEAGPAESSAKAVS